MQKYTTRPPVKTIHPLWILGAAMLYHVLYSGRLGAFGRFFLALVAALAVDRQQRKPPSTGV
ncbi:hypothetical protein [Chromobacterium vaccinii]|uniref:hypothetical protein n=1 Tax=Chromobacterium vaccinii TaxID=1108595 RepID=UPI00345921AD